MASTRDVHVKLVADTDEFMAEMKKAAKALGYSHLLAGVWFIAMAFFVLGLAAGAFFTFLLMT